MASISPAPTSNPTSSAGESFAALFEESLNRKEMRIGEVITAEVVSVDENFVVVNAGLKSESIIAVDEFRNDAGQVEVKPGDFVSGAIEALEDGYGAVLEETAGAERQNLLASLQEGATVKGIVKNITDYGAFVDLGGIDGLLHITDLAWRRVKHPSEVLNVGDEVTAKVLKFDAEKNRVSLGLKQLGEDPWVGIGRRYPQGTRLFGKVTNLTDYGAFVEVESGIEGLVHVSEMDWTNKNVHPSKVVQVGDEVEVMILEIDVERERISLGVKQLEGDPFTNFIAGHEKNSVVNGTVKSVDAKGAVVDIGGAEGYLRASEFSRDRVEDLSKLLKEGDTVQAMIINVDRKNRSINVSVKAKDLAEETDAMKQLRTEQAAASAGATNLGALLRAKLDKSGNNPQQ